MFSRIKFLRSIALSAFGKYLLDVVGDYECHLYNKSGEENDCHYVTVAESLDHQGLYWMNTAKKAWTLTPKVRRSRDKLFTHPECPYYDKAFGCYKECKGDY